MVRESWFWLAVTEPPFCRCVEASTIQNAQPNAMRIEYLLLCPQLFVHTNIWVHCTPWRIYISKAEAHERKNKELGKSGRFMVLPGCVRFWPLKADFPTTFSSSSMHKCISAKLRMSQHVFLRQTHKASIQISKVSALDGKLNLLDRKSVV